MAAPNVRSKRPDTKIDAMILAEALPDIVTGDVAIAQRFFANIARAALPSDGASVLFCAIVLTLNAKWWSGDPKIEILIKADERPTATTIAFGETTCGEAFIEDWPPTRFAIPLAEFFSMLAPVNRLFPGMFAATFGSRGDSVVLIRMRPIHRVRAKGARLNASAVRDRLQAFLEDVAETRLSALRELRDTSIRPPLPLVSSLPVARESGFTGPDGVYLFTIPPTAKLPVFTLPPPSVSAR